MSYEEEQKQLSAEVAVLQSRYNMLKEYFDKYPDAKKRQCNQFGWNGGRALLEKQAQHFNVYADYTDSDEYIQFRIIAERLSECKYRLKQSKTERAFYDGVKFMGSIAPQRVNGRIYKVENGDGCGKFCLWFVIIDAILCFIWFIISEW